MPNSTARRTARTSKPRDKKARQYRSDIDQTGRNHQDPGGDHRTPAGRDRYASDSYSGDRHHTQAGGGRRTQDGQANGRYRAQATGRTQPGQANGRSRTPAGHADDRRGRTTAGRNGHVSDRHHRTDRDSNSNDQHHRQNRRDDYSSGRRTTGRNATTSRRDHDSWENRAGNRANRTGDWNDRAGRRGRVAEGYRAERRRSGHARPTDDAPAERRIGAVAGGSLGAAASQHTTTSFEDPAFMSRAEATADHTAERGTSVTFADLGVPAPLLTALRDAGISEPFPIQSATLPDAVAGRDVLGRAQTGSGKTLAFGLALLSRLRGGKARPKHPRGLVLVPTRELAVQVTDALQPLAKSLGLWCRTVVGGLSFTRQVDQLRQGADLLIATPGRLSDHLRQGTCVLDDIRCVTVDEADQMADMGFLPQIRAILDLVPPGQRMLFSATLDNDVATLVDNYLTDPVTHSVSPPTATVSTMDHHLLLVSQEDKAAVVAEVAARDGRTILFLRTKHHVDRLTKQLRAVGVSAGALHGGKPQGARNRVLGEFRDGSLPVLVATDVAARGIHVDGVSLVVHVDPPADAKGYLHRAGRTARAGESGTVVTMVTHQERRTVFRMTEQAGVHPARTRVEPGHADLARITGARPPSGEPMVDRAPARQAGPGGRPRRGPRRSGGRPVGIGRQNRR